MNRVVLMGRLTRDPEVRYSQGENSICIARWTLAVDRRMAKKDENSQTADFVPCQAFGKLAEHAEKYYHQGMRILVAGRIRTGSYTNRDGQKVYTTDVVVEESEFAESKGDSSGSGSGRSRQSGGGSDRPVNQDTGFMSVPEGAEEEGLPFA